MAHMDRLSSLISHFEIQSRASTLPDNPNLVISGRDQQPRHVWLAFGRSSPSCPDEVIACANIDYGGSANPVLSALPAETAIALDAYPEILPLAHLIASEINQPRCGGQIALDRLCEFLVVSVLRKQIEAKHSDTGLLAGLADRHICPVLVAIHDDPGRAWKLDDLVALSGQSRSLFMESFHALLNVSPMAYLKQWRMTLARNALGKGERVKEVARKFGYGSGDAFTRAFTHTYGVAPTKLHQRRQDIERP